MLRIILDFSHIKNQPAKFLWFPLDTLKLSTIEDLKISLCEKFSLKNIELHVKNALLVNEDTINLIRDEDVVKLIQKDESEKLVCKSNQSLRSNENLSIEENLEINDLKLQNKVDHSTPIEFKKRKKKNFGIDVLTLSSRPEGKNSKENLKNFKADEIHLTKKIKTSDNSFNHEEEKNLPVKLFNDDEEIRRVKKKKQRKENVDKCFNNGEPTFPEEKLPNLEKNISEKNSGFSSETSNKFPTQNQNKKSKNYMENSVLGANETESTNSFAFNISTNEIKPENSHSLNTSNNDCDFTVSSLSEIKDIPKRKCRKRRRRRRKTDPFFPNLEMETKPENTSNPDTTNIFSSELKENLEKSKNNKHIKFDVYLNDDVSHKNDIEFSMNDKSTLDESNSSMPHNSFKDVSFGDNENFQNSHVSSNCTDSFSAKVPTEVVASSCSPNFVSSNFLPSRDDKYEQDLRKNKYSPLTVIPNVGAYIAYKTLELNELYCPEVSEYKEGLVKSIDSQGNIEVDFFQHEIKQSRRGKFELMYDDNEQQPEITKTAIVNWSNMIDPQIITKTN